MLVRRTEDDPNGRRDRKPLEISVRVNYVSGAHGKAAAAQGHALRELLAALDKVGLPPHEDADRAHRPA